MTEFFGNIFQLLLLLGSIYVITGMITKTFPPKKINALYGYRTPSSIKSQQAWDFAQKYSSDKMIQAGLFLIVISFLKIIIGNNYEGFISLFFLFSATIYLFFTTERALKNKFK